MGGYHRSRFPPTAHQNVRPNVRHIQKIKRVVKSQKIGNVKKKGLPQLLMEVVETEITTDLKVPNDEKL